MSAAGATERRASLYDEIADDDGRREPEATGKKRLLGRTTRADDRRYFSRWW